MDPSKVNALLERIDDEMDDLEESLAPLLKTSLSETTTKLPLLDKAKLYVLVTYAIESMLFSYLRLHGIDARKHPVFTELTRVKQYFEKLKLAEFPVGKRENMTLDTVAAARIVKHGLAGNDRWDENRANQMAAERAKAQLKSEELREKLKRTAENESSDLDPDSSSSDAPAVAKKSKKQKVAKNESVPTSGVSSASERPQGKRPKCKGRNGKE